VVPNTRPPLDQTSAAPIIAGVKSITVLRKHRGNNAPLQTPLLALGAQQPYIQSSRQHPALQAILPIVCGVIEQDAADGVRIVSQQCVPDGQSACNDRLFEIFRCPAFKWVALQGANKRYQLQRLRLRRGRTIREAAGDRSLCSNASSIATIQSVIRLRG
jgi:hypothetical protein